MKSLAALYGHELSGKGLISEGRGMYNEWNGSLQPPSFLIKDLKIEFEGYVDINDPYLGFVKARQFSFEAETFLELTDRLNESPKRLGTHAFWKSSFDEQIRKAKRIQNFISKTKIYEELKDLAILNKPIFLQALVIYYEGILKEGDFSQKQFEKDLTSKQNSSTGFVGFAKNRDVLNSPKLKTIYAKEVKDTKAELIWLIKHLKLAIEGKYDFKFIDPNFTINALRSRPPKITFTTTETFQYNGVFVQYRDRSAGGVQRISRLSWPIYKTKSKKPILKRLNDYLESQFKFKIRSMDLETVKFYISAAEAKISCYDVANAEKTWGVVFAHVLPGIIDFSHEEYFLNEFGPSLQSGIDITRIINWFGTLLVCQWLEKKGLIPPEDEIWMGGDNFGSRTRLEKPEQQEGEEDVAYLERLIEIDDGLWHIIDTDERILGFNPEKGRIGGLHFTIDGVDSMVAWNTAHNSYRWKQMYQKLTRLLDSVIQLDIYQEGTCLKFYQWILDNVEIDNPEIYNHDQIWKEVQEIFVPRVEEVFPGISEWCRAAFRVKDDLAIGRYVAESDCSLNWYTVSKNITKLV